MCFPQHYHVKARNIIFPPASIWRSKDALASASPPTVKNLARFPRRLETLVRRGSAQPLLHRLQTTHSAVRARYTRPLEARSRARAADAGRRRKQLQCKCQILSGSEMQTADIPADFLSVRSSKSITSSMTYPSERLPCSRWLAAIHHLGLSATSMHAFSSSILLVKRSRSWTSSWIPFFWQGSTHSLDSIWP
jgi:hypothetical protein